jgi:hypothetical protein
MQMTLDHRLSPDEIAEEAFPLGTVVYRTPYGCLENRTPDTVIGYWRGYVRIQDDRFGTSVCAAVHELRTA